MNKLIHFMRSNIKFHSNTTYRHMLFVSGVLLIILLVFIFYAFFNTFVTEKTSVAALDAIGAAVTLLIYIDLSKRKDIAFSAMIATLTFIIFLLLFVYEMGNSHFALIWTVFLPIFAIFANGKKRGLYFSLFFYAVLFTMAYINIGIWNNGLWGVSDFVRLVTASALLTVGMYLNENTYERYEHKLQIIRAREHKLMQKLSEQSITDELTQLYNRRYYDTLIEKIIANTHRNNECITFFIIDIDYFKNYNDYYGHQKGDQVLVLVANTIKKHIQRENDFVFRLGGEEFAGILTGDNPQKMQKWICQLTQKISDLSIEHKESKIQKHLTVSIGMSSYCAKENFSSTTLYKQADEALYSAKSHGRNRCEVAA